MLSEGNTVDPAFEARDALAVVGTDLGERPVSFAAAASAAVADGIGTVGLIAEASGRAGSQLPGLEDDTGVSEVEELVPEATLLLAKLEKLHELLLQGRVEDSNGKLFIGNWERSGAALPAQGSLDG